MRLARSFAAIVILIFAAACTDPVDKAAKARIFSPEDPPKAVSSAAEKLPPEDVASDARTARRVLGMGAAEATERLGPHKYTAKVSFEWTAGHAHPVKLEETRTLLAGRGGMSGDFHGTIQNSHDQGLEVIRAEGKVYARRRYGKFRERSRDRGFAEREREELYGAVRDIDSMFQGRLQLKPVGTVSVGDRTAWRYEVSLAPSAPKLAEQKLPDVQFAKGGPDGDTQRRLRFFEKREPVALSGEVMVDAQTSVVLKARLDGQIAAPGEQDGQTAKLRIVLNSEVTDIGKDPAITAPKEFLPDADKPQGIADALDQFGVERSTASDGGTPTKANSAEDDTDEEGN